MGAEKKAKPHRRGTRRWRQGAAWLGTIVVLYCLFYLYTAPRSENGALPLARKRPSESVLNSLFLTRAQCTETFPGLMQSVDDIVADGPFDLQDRGDLGPLQGKIKDGKVRLSKGLTLTRPEDADSP